MFSCFPRFLSRVHRSLWLHPKQTNNRNTKLKRLVHQSLNGPRKSTFKEITTLEEVWVCDHNYQKIRWTFAWNFSKNYEYFEKLYQTHIRKFHQISKHFEVGQKKLGCASFFQPTTQLLLLSLLLLIIIIKTGWKTKLGSWFKSNNINKKEDVHWVLPAKAIGFQMLGDS